MAPYEQQDTLDLRDYLTVLRRRRWLIVATVVIVVATAMAVTMLQTPLYQSTAELVVEPFDGPSDQSALERALLGNTELQTQRKLVESVPVAERVIEDLGLDRTPRELLEAVDVDVVTDTQVLEITATDEDPELAAAIAASVADSYLADRREQALERVLSATESLEERARTIRERIDELGEQIEAGAVEETTEATEEPTPAPTEASDLDALRQERDSLLTQLGQVTAQLSTFESRDALVRGGGEVIRPADVPGSPASPKPVRTGILALVLGLMLGVGLAFLRDFLDDAIHADEDAVRAAGAPVLGHIPYRAETEEDKRLATLVDQYSPKAEAFRTLRSNVRFVLYGGQAPPRGGTGAGRSLAVTSAVAAEGKTTTAANLAVAAARAGTKVLLVDADLRRPGVAKVLGLDNAPGLSDLLVGEVDLPDIVVDIGVPNLRVLTSGSIPPNPAELLAGPAMRELHLQLEQLSDLIVYDTAPVLAVADTLEVAPLSSGTLIVVDTREGSRRNVGHTADKLRGVGAEVVGTVLNNITPGDRYYYAYEQYDYGPDEESRPPASESGAWTAASRSPGTPTARTTSRPRSEEPTPPRSPEEAAAEAPTEEPVPATGSVEPASPPPVDDPASSSVAPPPFERASTPPPADHRSTPPPFERPSPRPEGVDEQRPRENASQGNGPPPRRPQAEPDEQRDGERDEERDEGPRHEPFREGPGTGAGAHTRDL